MRKKKAARAATGGAENKETAARLALTSIEVKPAILDFLRHPELKTFQEAFPLLVGRDLSFEDFREFTRDLPEPQNFLNGSRAPTARSTTTFRRRTANP